jgi:hypothetical protein
VRCAFHRGQSRCPLENPGRDPSRRSVRHDLHADAYVCLRAPPGLLLVRLFSRKAQSCSPPFPMPAARGDDFRKSQTMPSFSEHDAFVSGALPGVGNGDRHRAPPTDIKIARENTPEFSLYRGRRSFFFGPGRMLAAGSFRTASRMRRASSRMFRKPENWRGSSRHEICLRVSLVVSLDISQNIYEYISPASRAATGICRNPRARGGAVIPRNAWGSPRTHGARRAFECSIGSRPGPIRNGLNVEPFSQPARAVAAGRDAGGFEGSFTLRFKVECADQTLEPGDYSVFVDSSERGDTDIEAGSKARRASGAGGVSFGR